MNSNWINWYKNGNENGNDTEMQMMIKELS